MNDEMKNIIIEFLKDNLTIELRYEGSEINYGYKTSPSISVKLLFNGEVIDGDEIYLD